MSFFTSLRYMHIGPIRFHKYADAVTEMNHNGRHYEIVQCTDCAAKELFVNDRRNCYWDWELNHLKIEPREMLLYVATGVNPWDIQKLSRRSKPD